MMSTCSTSFCLSVTANLPDTNAAAIAIRSQNATLYFPRAALPDPARTFAGKEMWATGQWSETIKSDNWISIHENVYWSAIYVPEGDAWKKLSLTWKVRPPPENLAGHQKKRRQNGVSSTCHPVTRNSVRDYTFNDRDLRIKNGCETTPDTGLCSDHIGRKFGHLILSGRVQDLYWQMRSFGLEYFQALLVKPSYVRSPSPPFWRRQFFGVVRTGYRSIVGNK
jgi:hypothetical protein